MKKFQLAIYSIFLYFAMVGGNMIEILYGGDSLHKSDIGDVLLGSFVYAVLPIAIFILGEWDRRIMVKKDSNKLP